VDVSGARRARGRALVVPVAMSAALWVVAGGTVLTLVGWPVMLAPAAVLLLACRSRAGERWVARVVLLGRSPRLHQRHTLASVAQVLLEHGAGVEGLVLLVGPGRDVAVTAVGQRTVVVTRGLVDAVGSGRLVPVTAAALIAHELGVVRAGLTRGEVALALWLFPWQLWSTLVLALWGAVATVLPRRVMVACLLVNGAVGAWLGATVHPGHYAGAVFIGIVLWTWRAMCSWQRIRAQVGDHYLVRVGLGRPYANWLLANWADDDTRDRAVRLVHPDLQDPSSAGPLASHQCSVRR
jgi:hypothetical protein